MDARNLTDNDIQSAARRASTDRTSIYRRLLNLPVRGRAGERADEAIRELGLKNEPASK